MKWLVVSFPPRVRNPGGFPAWDAAVSDPPPFPAWIFRLKNLQGLSLTRYPHETLPEEIGNLTKLERFHCYGSSLTRLPRSMGKLQNLEELDCYTSYNLHYLPYEISRCPKLMSSRFSTCALYNNYKNVMPLPPLEPWGCEKRRQVTTPDSVSNVLAQVVLQRSNSGDSTSPLDHEKELFPLSFSKQHSIPLLP